MARFPDHVAFFDTGVTIPGTGGVRVSPGLVVNCLVAVHDKAQDGGVDNVSLGVAGAWTRVNQPFDVLYDVTISTFDYFALRDFFQTQRKRTDARQSPGIANVPTPNQSTHPHLFADGYVPRGVFRNPDRQNVVVRPTLLPEHPDPFGIPLDVQRYEQGLYIKRQLVMKELSQFVVKREVLSF